MQVSEVLDAQIERFGPGSVVLEVAQAMRSRNVGFVCVVEEERLMGVVTDRDIVVRCVASCCDPQTTTVADIMSVEVVCCFVDDSVEHALQLMAEHNVPRLPVIDREHHLQGLVTQADLQGGDRPGKPAMKVTFHKEKTDSYGRPHKVAVKTVYITGVQAGEEAKSAALRHLSQTAGEPWPAVASGVESELEPPVQGERSK